MNVRWLRALLGLVLLLAAVLPAGCEGLPNPAERLPDLGVSVPPAGPSGGQASQPAQGRLRLYGSNPSDLDPARAQDAATWQYLLQIYRGLVRLDSQLRVVPDAAESWQILNGGRTYRFALRSDLKFQDGRPITAADFQYSLERATDQATRSAVVGVYLGDIVGVPEKLSGRAGQIEGLKVVDDRTLEITIDAPKAYFLAKLTYPTAFVVDRANVQSGADWWRRPNGSGPFRVKEWVEDDHLLLERSDTYSGPTSPLREVSYYLGGGSPMTMYERDELDVTEVGLADVERVLDPDNALNRELQVHPMLSLWYIGLNSGQPPFDDPKVRQAFNYAADKDKPVNITFKQTRRKAEGVLPPGMPGYQAGLRGLGFDPEKARRLIAESSYGSVDKLPEITLTMGQGGGDLGQSLAEMYRRNLGVKINVTEVSDGYMQELSSRSYQMFYMGWVADYADPQDFLDVLLHGQSPANYGGYENAAVDRLLEQARVEPNAEKRLSMYAEAERLLVADAAIVPLFHDVSYVLVKPRVKGLDWSPMGVITYANTSVPEAGGG